MGYAFQRLLIAAIVVVAAFVSAHGSQVCSDLASGSKHDRAVLAAVSAGLHYHTPNYESGYRRINIAAPGANKPLFVYTDINGQEVSDTPTIHRLSSLGIPPAHNNVWISADPQAHIQGVSQDSKGKAQYFYHPRWIEIASDLKFQRTLLFGRSLPALMKKIRSDMTQHGLTKSKVVATVTRLLQSTLIRVGNVEGVQNNESFGLTTMLKSHLVSTEPMTLSFKGKSNKWHKKTIEESAPKSVILSLLKLPGENLFQYEGERGEARPISSNDVNDYIKASMGPDFSAKDFRTWMASYYALEYLSGIPTTKVANQPHAVFKKAAEHAAAHLGNTASVCRSSYIHPKIFEAYLDQKTFQAAHQFAGPTDDPIHNGLLRILESSNSTFVTPQ